MPNWVATQIKITGPYDDIVRLRDAVEGEDCDRECSVFCFDKIIPMPDDIFRGSLGSKEAELYRNKNWYDWSIENWGTKWDACYADRGMEIDTKTGKYTLEYYFETAWSFCEPIMKKLVEDYPTLKFTGAFADEDYGYNCGKFKGERGSLVCDYFEGGTKKAYMHAFKMWGTSLAEYAREVGETQKQVAEELWGGNK